METFKKHFFWTSIFTVICLIIWFAVWYVSKWTVGWWLSTMFIVLVLWLLESSISFDNAIVNVNVLKHMNDKWQRRFLTWWILIAVFGMRVLFPILLVSIFAGINPIEAVRLAIWNPEQYGQVLTDSHIVIAWFGGAFLMMVWLKFFLNKEKSIHRLNRLERWFTKLGKIEAIWAACVLIVLELFSYFIEPAHVHEFFVAGVWWIVLYIIVNWIEAFFGYGDHDVGMMTKAWLASFFYLEILDASFSLDWVIWAFALSNNLLVIAAGLGIGAFFVRSFTMYMLKKGTLASYRYLEHGAFYAVIALAIMMFVWAAIHLPEVLVWTIWLVFIALSLYSSRKAKTT